MITVDADEFVRRLKEADTWVLQHHDPVSGRYVLTTWKYGQKGVYLSPSHVLEKMHEWLEFIEQLGKAMGEHQLTCGGPEQLRWLTS